MRPALVLLILASLALGEDGPAPASVYVNYDDEEMNRLLAQAEDAAEAGDYKKATDRYQKAAEEATDHVRRMTERTFLGIREYVKHQVRSWPPEGLAAYRKITDARAEELYRTALDRGDPAALAVVARRYVMSSWGPRALMALGQRALARGDEDGALRHLLEILRLYPEGEIPGAAREEVVAQAALAAALRGDALLLAEMRERASRLPADATVRVAGERRRLEDLLAALSPAPHGTDAAEGWTTLGGSPARAGGRDGPSGRLHLYWAWTMPGVDSSLFGGSKPTHSPLLPVHPLIADGQVILVGHRTVHSLALPTTVPKRTKEDVARVSAPAVLWTFPSRDPADVVGPRSHEDLLPVFASTGAGLLIFPFFDALNMHRSEFHNSPEQEAVVCLSLSQRGKMIDQRGGLDTHPKADLFEDVIFSGAPIVSGGRAYVTGARARHRVETLAFCFDLTRGPGHLTPVWQTKVCLGSSRSRPVWQEWQAGPERVDASSLAMRNGILFLCSNTGAVAALDSDSGEILWIHAYEQAKRGEGLYTRELRSRATWFKNPPMLDHRLLYVAPTDADRLFIYSQQPDIGSGYVVTDEFDRSRDVAGGFDAEYVLGVRDGIVFLAGSTRARGERPLFAVKSEPVRAGDPRRVLWRADIEEDAPRGRGVVAGDSIYFPTAKGIYRISIRDGRAEKIVSPASPDVIAKLGPRPPERAIGNLAVAGPWLVSASEEMVCLFGPPPVDGPALQKEKEE